MMRIHLQQAIARAAGVSASEVHLEHPDDVSHGDYATAIALVLAKERGRPPHELAEEIVAALPSMDDVSHVSVAGPGFINITLERTVFVRDVEAIVRAGSVWGKTDSFLGNNVLVEYSQPNPFKPFHIGHLMSTTIGESISRLVENAGATIRRANYQGDIGPHVAKCLWGLQELGGDPHDVASLQQAYVHGNAAYEDDPQAKEDIERINRELYEGTSSLMRAYEIGRKTSLDRFEELYRMLNTRFDHYFFESDTGPVGMTMVKEGLAQGVFEESDGAIIYRGEKKGLHTRVFVSSKGTPLYETKELGLAKAKYDSFPYDLNITTVAVEQDEYFKVVRAALEDLIPEIGRVYTHVPHGMLQLTSGKMSSRKGNVITGESLIDEVRNDAYRKMEGRSLGEDERTRVATMVGVAALKYMILKQKTGKNVIFDKEQALSFEGDSGPYLQYSCVRAHSLLKRAVGTLPSSKHPPKGVTLVEKLLPRFPEVVERATKEYEPHYIATYLTALASAFNGWYAEERIIGGEYEAYSLLVVEAFKTTMEHGLWLLGIEVPEAM